MNKYCAILSCVFLLSGNFLEAILPPVEPLASYRLTAGFRQNDFHWRLTKNVPCDSLLFPLSQPSSSSSSSFSSSSFSSSDSDILTTSKTQLTSLKIFLISGEAKLYMCDWMYSRWNADIGWLYDGKYFEKDRFYFLEDSGPYRVKNRAKGTFVADISGAVGHRFYLMHRRLKVASVIGYALNTQQIRIKNNHSFKCNQPGFYSGVGTGGYNKYRFNWWGPWVGIDMTYWSNVDWILIGQVEYHFNRNHRKRITQIGLSKLDHHQNSVNGQGINLKVGYQCFFAPNYFAGIDVYSAYWSANTKRDRLSIRTRGIEFTMGYEY